jgi:ABC-type Co2+ transport system permease subunit
MLKPTPIRLNPEARRRQKQRNWALLGLLVALAILIMAVTIIRVTGVPADAGPPPAAAGSSK